VWFPKIRRAHQIAQNATTSERLTALGKEPNTFLVFWQQARLFSIGNILSELNGTAILRVDITAVGDAT
jgi:hypothetical protein